MRLDKKHETILVVDDSLAIRSLVRDALQHVGYTVVTAADGVEGLRIYEQQPADISLLLTDVTMPHMNGLDLADRVLEFDSQLPVLFMSAGTGNPCRGLGCLEKPFTFVELIGRVSQGLDARRSMVTELSNSEQTPCQVSPIL